MVFAAIVGVTIGLHGARLDAPADPSSNFDARPELYSRPLFQLLKYFDGFWEQIISLGAPAVAGGFLIALPFVDRGESRAPSQRKAFLGLLFAGVLGAGVLTTVSFLEETVPGRLL